MHILYLSLGRLCQLCSRRESVMCDVLSKSGFDPRLRACAKATRRAIHGAPHLATAPHAGDVRVPAGVKRFNFSEKRRQRCRNTHLSKVVSGGYYGKAIPRELHNATRTGLPSSRFLPPFFPSPPTHHQILHPPTNCGWQLTIRTHYPCDALEKLFPERTTALVHWETRIFGFKYT